MIISSSSLHLSRKETSEMLSTVDVRKFSSRLLIFSVFRIVLSSKCRFSAAYSVVIMLLCRSNDVILRRICGRICEPRDKRSFRTGRFQANYSWSSFIFATKFSRSQSLVYRPTLTILDPIRLATSVCPCSRTGSCRCPSAHRLMASD
jgi:hypothetical protein